MSQREPLLRLRDREWVSRTAAAYIVAAIDFPVGALLYTIGGWWLVAGESAVFVLVAVGLVIQCAWREAKEMLDA